MNIEKEINKILDRYYDGERYTHSRHEESDGKEVEIYFADELKQFCEANNVIYKYEMVDAYDSCGYDCRVGAVAFIDENSELQLITVIYEYY